MRQLLTVALLALVFASSAGPAAASCAADSGPAGSAVIFTGTAVEERRGFTRFDVDEVWAGPDLAPEVWVLSGQRQPPWPLYVLSGVASSVDAEFEPGVRYAVGATSDFATSACSVAEVSSVPNLRPADVRTPVAGGSHGSDAPAGPWLTGLGFVALVGIPVGVGAALLAHRRRRVRDV